MGNMYDGPMAPASSPEGQVRAALLAAKDPRGKKMAEQKKVVKYITNQLKASAALAKNMKNPRLGISSIVAKKILYTAGFVSDADMAQCGIAVSILAAEGATAVAAGVPTMGIGTVLMGVGVLSAAYEAYGSCKAYF